MRDEDPIGKVEGEMKQESSRSAPEPKEVVEELRGAVASVPEGAIKLLPGLTDGEMDSWDASVPENIRVMLRRVGGFRFGDDYFGPGNPLNDDTEDINYIRSGDPGTFRIICEITGLSDFYYVDVDPESGEWGKVFYSGENNQAELVSSGFLEWMMDLAWIMRRACGDLGSGYYESFEPAFYNWLFGEFSEAGDDYDFDDPAVVARENMGEEVAILEVLKARYSTDQAIREVALRLSDESLFADLRGASCPAVVNFGNHPEGGYAAVVYRRFNKGDFISATPYA